MSRAIVVNIHNVHADVYCGRAGKGERGTYGNPFKGPGAIMKFGYWFNDRLVATTKEAIEYRLALEWLVTMAKGKKDGVLKLGCFCKPRACHVDVIADYVNMRLMQEG